MNWRTRTRESWPIPRRRRAVARHGRRWPHQPPSCAPRKAAVRRPSPPVGATSGAAPPSTSISTTGPLSSAAFRWRGSPASCPHTGAPAAASASPETTWRTTPAPPPRSTPGFAPPPSTASRSSTSTTALHGPGFSIRGACRRLTMRCLNKLCNWASICIVFSSITTAFTRALKLGCYRLYVSSSFAVPRVKGDKCMASQISEPYWYPWHSSQENCAVKLSRQQGTYQLCRILCIQR